MRNEIFFTIFATIYLFENVSGIKFNLQPNSQKCLRDEMNANMLVVGEYEVAAMPGQVIDYEVRDTKQHILSKKDDISRGKFSFTSEIFDVYELCFISKVPANVRGMAQEVSINVKKGVETKSYEGIAEAAKLKPLELELKKLEDLSDAIVQEFALMRKREEEMRDTNESTNNRVLFFSIFGMCCLLGLATWQVLYLRRYFIAKKLIEK
jgi:hypothetical protein